MKDIRNRAVIENISPSVSEGKHAIKRIVGEKLRLEADVFGDGHAVVNAWFYVKHQSEKAWKSTPLTSIINDRWYVEFVPEKQGFYTYKFEAWVDYALNWQHELRRKVKGGQHVDVELLDGIQYLDSLKKLTATEKKLIAACKSSFKDKKAYDRAIELAQSDELEFVFRKYPHITFKNGIK